MGTLFVVGTPIGNLADMTYRAVETLRKVDFIACEDTRRTQLLLAHYGISKTLISYHQHSHVAKVEMIAKKMVDGEDGALVSDAGTPGIADPGGTLVAAAVKAGVKVVPIPGVSAVAAILSVCGWPTNEFVFLGYLPKKKGRQTLLEGLKTEKRVMVFYESPERIERTVSELLERWGENVEVVVGRELTKVYEEVVRGRIGEILKQVKGEGSLKKKGEFVICVRII